jgi:hypothetical protein
MVVLDKLELEQAGVILRHQYFGRSRVSSGPPTAGGYCFCSIPRWRNRQDALAMISPQQDVCWRYKCGLRRPHLLSARMAHRHQKKRLGPRLLETQQSRSSPQGLELACFAPRRVAIERAHKFSQLSPYRTGLLLRTRRRQA